jgi:hypothetical protein
MDQNLDFVDFEDLERGATLIQRLRGTVQEGRYDVVIVDPVMDAYPVEDENDNAQASKQMLAFRELARWERVGVVVVHNAGRKAEESSDDSAFLGRGATARADKADVGINFVRDGEDPARDRALVVAKSRQPNLGARIRFQFADNLSYELLDDQEVLGSTGTATLAADVLAFVTREIETGRPEVSRKGIQEALELTTNEKDKKRLTRALGKLVEDRKLVKPREAWYTLPGIPAEASGVSTDA